MWYPRNQEKTVFGAIANVLGNVTSTFLEA